MQLRKHVPLEGSLGVRKTSLIIVWGKGSGLKEALKEGCWVFLDDHHLAQQYLERFICTIPDNLQKILISNPTGPILSFW